jgi:hypothetical protein
LDYDDIIAGYADAVTEDLAEALKKILDKRVREAAKEAGSTIKATKLDIAQALDGYRSADVPVGEGWDIEIQFTTLPPE